MNTEFFIAKRLVGNKKENSQTRSIVNIAVISIALGVVVMILSVAIVTGFKNEVRNKVIGFGSHITITNFDSNTSYETVPIEKNQTFLPELKKIKELNHMQVYGLKAGIITTDENMQGVVLKGVGSDFDWTFFQQNTVEGTHFTVQDSAKTNDVVLSKYLCNLLKIRLHDTIKMYFIQEPPRFRKLNVVGIYETSLEDYDKVFVFADIAHIQKLNNWTNTQISGFELTINNFEKLEAISERVNEIAGYQFTAEGGRLKIQNVKENNPQIFDWLSLSDTNVAVILTLMLIVAGFNMIAALLILILEQTQTIGILKSLGTNNWSIRKIFLYHAAYLVTKGLLWGNIIGISLCWLQSYFKIIKIDATSYYVSSVPINLNITHLIVLNLGTLIIIVFMLVLPSYLITRISPVKAIRFD